MKTINKPRRLTKREEKQLADDATLALSRLGIYRLLPEAWATTWAWAATKAPAAEIVAQMYLYELVRLLAADVRRKSQPVGKRRNATS